MERWDSPTALLRAHACAPEHTLTLLLVGATGAGKTCLMRRYLERAFAHSEVSLVRVVAREHDVELDGTFVRLRLLDWSGEPGANVSADEPEPVDGAMLVYDAGGGAKTLVAQLECALSWERAVRTAGSGPLALCLVGAQVDRCTRTARERALERTLERAEEAAHRVGAAHFVTSARTGANVAAAFETLARRALARRIAAGAPDARPIEPLLRVRAFAAVGDSASSAVRMQQMRPDHPGSALLAESAGSEDEEECSAKELPKARKRPSKRRFCCCGLEKDE